ncbi:MAG: serine/threonine-protein kinase [Gemmataceae bacterium]
MNRTEEYRPGADDRLVEAVREYQAAVEAGQTPDRGEFLARYADVADDLAECLDGLAILRSAAPGLRPPDAPPQDGTLGDYRLVREIGRGGMGVVYEAEQISLGRRVALKVLPLAGTLDARQTQRFENEARAAAALHHPNIVPVFAVGRERGVPYYAMQLIEGRTLADVIEDLRQQPSPGAPAAETAANAASFTRQSVDTRAFFRRVAELGVQAAEALEYAHQMGVVHRDVKPANLLLDGRGNLWVADFGLARIQSGPGVTTPGDLVGTLRYMSPEQAAGQPVIDPRSDVYSLGVTLYELLTRRPAFDGRDRRECLRQVLEEEATPPRRLNPALPAELETVVLKAMAKRPEDRYAGAREFADDLRRFLDDRPVQARPPGLQERAVKWARRHRRLVAGLLVGLVATVLILGATTWRVAVAEAKARASLEEEAAQRERAERNFRQARRVLDFVTHFGVEELDDRPEFRRVRRQLLTKLIEYYKEFVAQEGSDSSVGEELYQTQLRLAALLDEVGRREESFAMFEKAMRFPGGPPPDGPMMFRGPPRGLMRVVLLGQPEVRKELNLSQEQARELSPFTAGDNRPRPGHGLLEAEKKADEVLTPSQAGRLQQIIRQARGPEALLDAAGELGLSERQVGEIRSCLGRGGPPGKGKGKGPWGPPTEKDRRQENDRALAVLSPAQRQKWEAMLGEPFRGEIRFFGAPFRQPGPPPPKG